MNSKLMLRVYNAHQGERAMTWLGGVNTKDLGRLIYFRTGHLVGGSGNLIFKPIEGNITKLSEILDNEDAGVLVLPLDSYSPRSSLRIISTEKALNVDVDLEGAEPISLVMISVDKDKPGWRSDKKNAIPVRLCLNKQTTEILSSAVLDVLLDIQIANSQSVWPIVSAAVLDKGHAWVYKQKVNFVIEKGHTVSAYGPVDDSSGYVSFSSIARSKSKEPSDFVREIIRLWDEFIVCKLDAYLPKDVDLARFLTKTPPIGGQLKGVEKILGDLEGLKKGAYLLLFANKPNKYAAQFTTNPSLPIARRGSTSIIKACNIDLQVQNYLREGILQTTKFYKK